ncbi:uncharacterized protein LOC105703647 isoform X2 [Orussus abietinus]|uniref:uncharacterized protein LOC105703647 isoform X2 n=1 Tax=Orussus abietinus TaxID=222816 RepID=UPI00062568A1|nr:uncharacterized protein LOC105703647 isoform X2 [Orussus abietinus]
MGTMHRRERDRTRKKGKESQNDIKKLRRENEQLRREIWSLRDEYDKLEEILKSQKSHEGSDDYEGRYDDDDDDEEEEDGEEEDLSEDEDDQEDEEVAEENRDERLENAENLKISTEKMSGGVHRLHVEFDDLSVVDEEEELKKEKDRKESCTRENEAKPGGPKTDVKSGYRYFGFETLQGPLQSPLQGALQGSSRYQECPFVFPSPGDPNYPKVHPDTATLLMTPCSTLAGSQLTPIPSVDSSGLGSLSPIFGSNEPILGYSQIPICTPPVGWQSALTSDIPGSGVDLEVGTRVPVTGTNGSSFTNGSNCTSGSIPGRPKRSPAGSGGSPCFWQARTLSGSDETPISWTNGTTGTNVIKSGSPKTQTQESGSNPFFGNDSTQDITGSLSRSCCHGTLQQRRNLSLRCLGNGHYSTPRDKGEVLSKDFWDLDGASGLENGGARNGMTEKDPEEVGRDSRDRPRHFFAPLPSKTKRHSQDDRSPEDLQGTAFNTGTSSSSDRTTSTVVSRTHHQEEKGPADVFVDGGVSAEEDPFRVDQKTFLSTENLRVDDVRDISRQGSNNTLVKSLSCQDLVSEQQMLKTINGESQMMTKSDNTLDSLSILAKPFRSQLHVTLKRPNRSPPSPETPEIPSLPRIDYRLFSNPFLRSFDKSCEKCLAFGCPVTRPLTVQVNGSFDRSADRGYPSPLRNSSGTPGSDFCPGRFDASDPGSLAARDQGDQRTLVQKNPPAFQVTSFEGPCPQNLVSPCDQDTLRGLSASSLFAQNRRLYQNLPFVPRAAGFAPIASPQGLPTTVTNRIYFEGPGTKVPAQTQTSLEVDPQVEKESSKPGEAETPSVPSSPVTLRRRKTSRKDRSGSAKDKRPLSPAAQRRRERLRKQSSVNSTDATDEQTPKPSLRTTLRPRKMSATTTTTTSEVQEKNESRSSSSGQDSPRKEQNRRVSLYFGSKKRPSLTSTRTLRSASLDSPKTKYLLRGDTQEVTSTNSEERTNSISSREVSKERKMSTGSGKVPWCACWGNGCI